LRNVFCHASRVAVIRSFSCGETEKLFHGLMTRTLPADLRRRARAKLLILHAATNLDDLKSTQATALNL
jgi:proteic killer suppression protein